MKTLIFVVGMVMMTGAVHLYRKSFGKRVALEPQKSTTFRKPIIARQGGRSNYSEHDQTLV